MKLTKIDAGSYRYGKWQIQKISGAWLVEKGMLYPEYSTWENTLKGAKEFITRIEAMA